MFSFVHVILLVAIIARTQAVKCYKGLGNEKYYPPRWEKCAPGKYCFVRVFRPLGAPDNTAQYSCDYTGLVCRKKGCEKVGGVTTCCCDSDLCNRLK
ncbi:unnamed protein product [Cylicocyclus nassatus]|uniref:Uncharacterized protein n=1 Tax=Cylicocyclus nassatus TaxID=53992 RepID=A0AA36GTN5_CYLNA|nr:unnamed protein product [Cylicocyclus nassatus]